MQDRQGREDRGEVRRTDETGTGNTETTGVGFRLEALEDGKRVKGKGTRGTGWRLVTAVLGSGN